VYVCIYVYTYDAYMCVCVCIYTCIRTYIHITYLYMHTWACRIHACHMRRRIHACHMRRRIHACHMRRRIHIYTCIPGHVGYRRPSSLR
jgi:hypothetical protein